MSNDSGSKDVQRLRQQLAARTERAPTLEEIARAESEETTSEVTQRAEAAYWRQRYERSRLRLGKLWVAYKDLEAELEMRKEELEVMAEQKAAALLEERGRGDLLAIAAPDGFEVVSKISEREVEPGGGTSFPVVMTNRTDGPVAIELAAGEVDEGWQLLLTVDEIELEPKASQTVHVIVRSRDQVEPGDVGAAQVIIRAEGEEPRELELRTTVVEAGTLDAVALSHAEAAEPEAATPDAEADGLLEEVVVEEPATQAIDPENLEAAEPPQQTVDEVAAGIEGRAIRIADPKVDDEAEPFEQDGFVLHCAVAQDEEEDASMYVFFFADGRPEDAFPVTLPEGYEALEDDETGIPYLSPLPEGAEAEAVEPDADDGEEDAEEAQAPDEDDEQA